MWETPYVTGNINANDIYGGFLYQNVDAQCSLQSLWTTKGSISSAQTRHSTWENWLVFAAAAGTTEEHSWPSQEALDMYAWVSK